MNRRAEIVTTSTGIHIGGAYMPPGPPHSADAEVIQDALLGNTPPRLERAAGAFEEAGPWLFGAVCVFAALAATAKWLGWL